MTARAVGVGSDRCSGEARPYLTIAETAVRLRCSTKTVRRYVASGKLVAYRVGRRIAGVKLGTDIRIDSDDLAHRSRRQPARNSATVVSTPEMLRLTHAKIDACPSLTPVSPARRTDHRRSTTRHHTHRLGWHRGPTQLLPRRVPPATSPCGPAGDPAARATDHPDSRRPRRADVRRTARQRAAARTGESSMILAASTTRPVGPGRDAP